MLIDVSGSPYYLPPGADEDSVGHSIRELAERIELLRSQGKLSASTLREYYGDTRFEQVAESNALEGSTLSVGETELAVMKGITIAGHDPAFAKDAQAINTALVELTEMAKVAEPTDIAQAKRLQELILGDRPGAGLFRSDEVRISGSQHKPPRTLSEVLSQMEQWEAWSRNSVAVSPLIRAAVLHAWLEHIHPFIDGNGRTGRAITNLELVRAGYPPIVVRRKDKDRYLEALARADDGDLGAFMDIVVGRMDDALRDLERAAERKQGYDVLEQKVRKAQSNRLALWNAGVHLLFENVRSILAEHFASMSGDLDMREYDELRVDDFIELCEGRTIRLSWAFAIRCRAPGMPTVDYLAWAGVAGEPLRSHMASEPGRPVLMWSVPNSAGYPPWTSAGGDSPADEQMTILRDRWIVAKAGTVTEHAPSELANKIAGDILERTIPSASL